VAMKNFAAKGGFPVPPPPTPTSCALSLPQASPEANFPGGTLSQELGWTGPGWLGLNVHSNASNQGIYRVDHVICAAARVTRENFHLGYSP
jgi:hypothetical protein